jgi:hypothetical protein
MSNPNLIRQIEYYLSEDNLQNDEYFYKEVSSNPYLLIHLENTLLKSPHF